MKTGVPTSAVITPGGSSVRADRAAERVDEQHERRAEDGRDRQHARELRAHQQARGVRDDEADPADHAGDRHAGRGDERRRDDHREPQLADVDAERARLVVGEREQVDAPAQQRQRHEADARSAAARRRGPSAARRRSCPAART